MNVLKPTKCEVGIGDRDKWKYCRSAYLRNTLINAITIMLSDARSLISGTLHQPGISNTLIDIVLFGDRLLVITLC